MVQLAFGTVLDDGEDPGSERSIAAAGPAVAVLLHGSYEQGAPLDSKLGRGHGRDTTHARGTSPCTTADLISVTERDRPYITGELISAFAYTGSAGADRREDRGPRPHRA